MTTAATNPSSYHEPGPKVPVVLVAVIAANVVFGTGLFFHAFLYNFYLDALGSSETVMGNAAAALTLGGLVALLPAGAVTDRLGVRASLVAAAVLVTAGLAAGAVAEHPVAIYAAAVVAGAGGGGWRVAVPPTLMRLAGPAIRPRVFAWNVGLLVASGGIGMAVAGTVPEWLESRLGLAHLPAIRTALLLGAAGSALSIPLFAALPRLSGSAVQRSAARSARQEAATGTPPRRGLGLGLAPMILFVFAWMLGAALAAPFLNIYFTRRFGLAVAQVGVIFAVAHLLWGAGVFLSGGLAFRAGVLRLLTVAVTLFAPAMLGLAWAAAVPLAVALYMVQGLIGPVTNPLIDQLLLGRAPAERHGLVSGWRNAAADLSALVGATVGGALLAATSFAALLAAASAVGLAGGAGLIYTLRSAPAPTGDATQGDPLPAGERDGL